MIKSIGAKSYPISAVSMFNVTQRTRYFHVYVGTLQNLSNIFNLENKCCHRFRWFIGCTNYFKTEKVWWKLYEDLAKKRGALFSLKLCLLLNLVRGIPMISQGDTWVIFRTYETKLALSQMIFTILSRRYYIVQMQRKY